MDLTELSVILDDINSECKHVQDTMDYGTGTEIVEAVTNFAAALKKASIRLNYVLQDLESEQQEEEL